MPRRFAVLVLVFLFLAVFPHAVHAESSSALVGRAGDLVFNVLPLDTEKYVVSVPQYSAATGFLQQKYIDYNLTASGSVARVQCTFQNGSLFTLIATTQNGNLLYANPSRGVLDTAKLVMVNYQSFLGDNSLREMINALDSMTVARNFSVTTGDIKLNVTVSDVETSFVWKHVYFGCEYSEVTLVFQEQNLFMLGDMQSRYKMGDPTVAVSKPKALDRTADVIANYSYLSTAEDGSIISVGDFNVSKEVMNAKLVPYEFDGLLYPVWQVEVPLSHFYPSHPRAFMVTLWADSGKCIKLEQVSPGGAWQLDFGNPEFDATNKAENDMIMMVNLTFRILAVVAIILSIIYIWRTLKKTKKVAKT